MRNWHDSISIKNTLKLNTQTHLHISFDPKILFGNILEDLGTKIIKTLKCQRVVKP